MPDNRLIAVTGLAGSGKSTVARMIREVAGYTAELAFAEPLKRFVGEVFGFTHEELYGPSEARSRPSSKFKRPTGEPLTARYALQTLGTEWGRGCDPDVWAKAGIARARQVLESRVGIVVITDLRFPNEAKLVREAGGEVWRIAGRATNVDTHPSEAGVWCAEMNDHVSVEITNGGTLEQLQAMVGLALGRPDLSGTVRQSIYCVAPAVPASAA